MTWKRKKAEKKSFSRSPRPSVLSAFLARKREAKHKLRRHIHTGRVERHNSSLGERAEEKESGKIDDVIQIKLKYHYEQAEK
jgi:hypothetical protein